MLFSLENIFKIWADFLIFFFKMYLNNVGLLGRNFRLWQICCLLGFVFFITVQIAIVFVAKVLEHVLNLCRGNYDFLEWLPVPLLLYIISFLELEDIARLSQVSHRFEMVRKKIFYFKIVSLAVQHVCFDSSHV